MPPVRAPSPRSVVTRRALLDAARAEFTAQGYTAAAITGVVNRAGASVGALYHHFGGGKAELYRELYDEFTARQMAATHRAVAAAREAGVADPMALFLAGTRAYLDACRADRDLARLFLDGGGPPGFEAVVRRRSQEWIRQNSTLLRAEERRNGEALVHTMTTVAGTAGREVARARTAGQARQLADDFLDLLARLATAPG